MSDVLYQTPPHSMEAEQAVLGMMLSNPIAISLVAEQLAVDDFYSPSHQMIYEAALRLFRAGDPVDLLFVSEDLQEHGVLDEVGPKGQRGRDYINALAINGMGFIAERICHYAELVKTHAIRRKVITLGLEIATAGHLQDDLESLELAQREILKLVVDADHSDEISTAELVTQSLQMLIDKAQNPRMVTGLSTGFRALDEQIGGLNGSNLYILAARPAMGKTGLVLEIAKYVAMHPQKPVLFYSLEMSREQMMARALVSEAQTYNKIADLQRAASFIPDHFRIIEPRSLNVQQLRASIIRHQMEFKELGLIVIDYLGLMDGEGKSPNEKVASISRELKRIAREFNVPVLCLSQLSRQVESRQDKRPMLSDLRDSGAIEQDADVVMFIYRDEYYNPDSKAPDTAEIIVAKNRHGSTGTVNLIFRKAYVKFMNQIKGGESIYA